MDNTLKNLPIKEHHAFVHSIRERLSSGTVFDINSFNPINNNVSSVLSIKNNKKTSKYISKYVSKYVSTFLLIALFFGFFYLFILRNNKEK